MEATRVDFTARDVERHRNLAAQIRRDLAKQGPFPTWDFQREEMDSKAELAEWHDQMAEAVFVALRSPSRPPDEPSVARERFEKVLDDLIQVERRGLAVSRNAARAEVLRLYDAAASRSPAPPVVTDDDVERGLHIWAKGGERMRRVLEDYASRQGERRNG